MPTKQLNLAFKIETHIELVSTQDEMRARVERGENVHGLVIRALQQSGGRGTRRRDWRSGVGGSYQTLAVRDNEGRLKRPDAAIAIALGLAQTMLEYGIQVGVKWPNDLHYCGKKVAGILCEYVQGHLLAAVGMNVNNDVPAGAIALRGLDTAGVSNFVLAGMQQGLALMLEHPSLATLYTNYDVLAGKHLELTLNAQTLRGVGRGITKQGCLRLEVGSETKTVCQSAARSTLRIVKERRKKKD